MRSDTTLIILIPAMGMSFALPTAAKKPVALILNSARACAAASLPRHGGVPIGSGQVPPPLRHAGVAPTLRSAQKRGTGILPVKGHGQDGHGTSMTADLKVSATTPGTNSAKPFTQEQVQGLVRDGLGDDSGAKLIEQRGIDFAPSEEFIQTLKAAGASEAFLSALRAAKPPEPTITKKPINQVQVFALSASQVPSHRVSMLVQERGIDLEPTGDYLQEVRLAGGRTTN